MNTMQLYVNFLNFLGLVDLMIKREEAWFDEYHIHRRPVNENLPVLCKFLNSVSQCVGHDPFGKSLYPKLFTLQLETVDKLQL